MEATGPVGHARNLAVFLTLYLTCWNAPALEVTSDAALVFYGGSMLLAALCGYAGCEVLAVSNWLLGRDDQIGCAVFCPSTTGSAGRSQKGPPARPIGPVGDRQAGRGGAR